MIYACDRSYWRQYADRIGHVAAGAELWTINREAAAVHGLNLIGHEKGDGIAKRPGCIRDGGNSGYQAVSLAMLFGAERIVLLGFDMQATGRRLHWHSDHSGGLANPVPQKFKDWGGRFGQLAKLTQIQIINASRESALDCFPRVPLEEALA